MKRRVTVSVMVFEVMLLNDCIQNSYNAEYSNSMNVKSGTSIISPAVLLQRISGIKIFPVSEGRNQRGNHGSDYKKMPQIADEVMHLLISCWLIVVGFDWLRSTNCQQRITIILLRPVFAP